MRRIFKLIGIVIALAGIALAALYGAAWVMFHHYWEAEPRVVSVWALADIVRESALNRAALPATLDEAYTLISPEHRTDLARYEAIWTPHEDIVYRIRINRKYGFTIDAKGNPEWLWKEEQVRKAFALKWPPE